MVTSGEPGSESFPDILLGFLVELREIVPVVVDPGADGKREPM
jgi:hypothetical protein